MFSSNTCLDGKCVWKNNLTLSWHFGLVKNIYLINNTILNLSYNNSLISQKSSLIVSIFLEIWLLLYIIVNTLIPIISRGSRTWWIFYKIQKYIRNNFLRIFNTIKKFMRVIHKMNNIYAFKICTVIYLIFYLFFS